MVFGWFQKEEPFDRIKLKTSLKMAVTRLQMQRNKKENAIKVQRREVAGLLASGKVESARIKVEGLIRDEYMIEAFELVTLFCDLLSTRLQLIVEARSCPADMKEGVSTLIWAAPRVENVPELLTIREQLARKFGMDFALAASDNSELAVNQKVLYRLSLQVPEPYLCLERLRDIAAQYEVDWEPAGDGLVLPLSGLGAGIGSLPEGPIPSPFLPVPANNALSVTSTGSGHSIRPFNPNQWPPANAPGPSSHLHTPAAAVSSSSSSFLAPSGLQPGPAPTHNPQWRPPPVAPQPAPSEKGPPVHFDFDPVSKSPGASHFQAIKPQPDLSDTVSSVGATCSYHDHPTGSVPIPFHFDEVAKPQSPATTDTPQPPGQVPRIPDLPLPPQAQPPAHPQQGRLGEPPVDFSDLEARFAALRRSGPS